MADPTDAGLIWSCNACPWMHLAHPTYGWGERDDRAVEVHQTMLCPDAITADGHACVGDGCAGCAAALAAAQPPEGTLVRRRRFSIVAVFWHLLICPRGRRAFRDGRMYECPCGHAVVDAYGMGGAR